MLEIGRIQSLKIEKLDESGAWFKAGPHRILLPVEEVPAATAVGARLEVFLYRRGDGEMVATLRRPKAQEGEFALLKVRQVAKPGAFLDWGMEKDLLVPYSEQPEPMKAGRSYIVKVCVDSLGRMVGTGRIDRCLETEPVDLKEGEEVRAMIWEFTDLGAKVIINDLYGGLVYQDELPPGLKRGDRLRTYVRKIREDNKIDLSLRKSGPEGVEDAKTVILEALRKQGGFLPLHDQSSPEELKKALGLSKKSFKKAVGGLYKAGQVELTEAGIRLLKD